MKEGRLTTRCGTPSYCAPELLSGEGYGKAVDMWSVGVLAYILLCGVLPFVGAGRAELFRKIRKGQYGFAGPGPAADVSELARDLVGRLLRLAPMERYSTRETLQHPWIVSAGQDDNDAHGADGGDRDSCRGSDEGIDGNGRRRSSAASRPSESLDTVHEMMRRFNAERRLRRAFWVVVACGRFERGLGLHGGWPDDGGGGGGAGCGGGSGEMSGWPLDGPPPPPPPPDD